MHWSLQTAIRTSLAGALIMVAALTAAAQTASHPQTSPPALRIQDVRSWGYQLQRANPAEIAASPFDLVVVDYSRNGVDEGRYTPAEVKSMQTKPGGGRRLVLAYMSIGEAEDYRFYWQRNWVEPAPVKRGLAALAPPPATGAPAAPSPQLETVRIPRLTAPGWLGRENEVWAGNFLVRYWYDGWQDIIMHKDESYLARIQRAGFDGVYLDRVDAFYAVENDRRDSARRMIDFVVELGTIARTRRPGFLVVPQNGEELLDDARYVAAIDAVAKEDLLLAAGGAPSPPARIATSSKRLNVARAAGRPVLAVEYTEDAVTARSMAEQLRARGMLPYIGTRKLDRLVVPQPVVP